MHSLLKLPIGSRGNKDLTGQSLCRLQESVNNIEYIIIDEYSMLGQVIPGWVDKRCKKQLLQWQSIWRKIFDFNW